MKLTITALTLSVLLSFATSCAAPARSMEMIPHDVAVQAKHPVSISTRVMGGADTNSMGASKISNEAFHEALDEAIRESGVFKEVVAGDEGDYQLLVAITNLDQPFAGFSMQVNLIANWRLKKRGAPQSLWDEYVSGTHTATPGDAFAGVTRLKLANEGAARANIREGLQMLSKLELVSAAAAPPQP